jgi:ABC-type nitrate/sulfonate/bicarbonate transport system permease component
MAEAHPTRRWTGLALLAALLVLWEVSAATWVSSSNWPRLSEVFKAMVEGLRTGELTGAFLSSLGRMAAGYAAGSAVAVMIGVWLARVRLARTALEPLFEFLRPIPIPAIVPPLILLLGVDDAMKIFVVAFASFFPVLINTMGGVSAVDRTVLDVARTFQHGRLSTIWTVVLPASLPYILAGLRVSLALALIITVVAEMIAGSAGIGYYIVTMQYAMRSGDMYAAILLLAATGYALNRLILAVEQRVIHWFHHAAA